MSKTLQVSYLPLALAVFVLGGCGFDHPATGPMRSEPVSIDLGDTERANVELNMGAGEMTLGGGAQKLLEGTFEYNVPEWKPIVRNSSVGSHAAITIQQPRHTGFGGNTHYRWDLKVNDSVPVDLAVHCGAGQAQLKVENAPVAIKRCPFEH